MGIDVLVDAFYRGAGLPLELVPPHNLLRAVKQLQLLIDGVPDALLNPEVMATLLFVMGLVVGQFSVVGRDAGQFAPDGGAVEAELSGDGGDGLLGLVKCLELIA
ncbi:hypothetical protein DEMA109039_22745 [Deinococcus marmoris]